MLNSIFHHPKFLQLKENVLNNHPYFVSVQISTRVKFGLVIHYNVASHMTDKLHCVRISSAMGGQPNFPFPMTWLHAVPKALPRKLNTINQPLSARVRVY